MSDQLGKPRKPKCEKCRRSSDVHLAPRPGQIPGSHGAQRYICASCEYLESRPDAAGGSARARPERTSGGDASVPACLHAHMSDQRRSLRHVSVALDRSGGWPVYAQRSAPFGRFTGVYHVWVWPLRFQVVVGASSFRVSFPLARSDAADHNRAQRAS